MSFLSIPFLVFAFLIAFDLIKREDDIDDGELKFELLFGLFLFVIGLMILMIF